MVREAKVVCSNALGKVSALGVPLLRAGALRRRIRTPLRGAARPEFSQEPTFVLCGRGLTAGQFIDRLSLGEL
jgi:hypothetical protein